MRSGTGTAPPKPRSGSAAASARASARRPGAASRARRPATGVAIKGFEGGQMPLHRRLPKRGFNNIFAKKYNELNLGRIQQAVDSGRLDAKKPITIDALKQAGLIRRDQRWRAPARPWRAQDQARLRGDRRLGERDQGGGSCRRHGDAEIHHRPRGASRRRDQGQEARRQARCGLGSESEEVRQGA